MASSTASQTLNRGGSFLISTSAAEDVFTPADLTDDQRLIGQTAEEFVQKEVVPNIPELEAHKDEKLMAQMLKKAGEIGLLGGGIPEEYGGSGLDKISAICLAACLPGHSAAIPVSACVASTQRRRPLGMLQLSSLEAIFAADVCLQPQP